MPQKPDAPTCYLEQMPPQKNIESMHPRICQYEHNKMLAFEVSIDASKKGPAIISRLFQRFWKQNKNQERQFWTWALSENRWPQKVVQKKGETER